MKKKTVLNVSVLAASNGAVRLMGMLTKIWLSKQILPGALARYQLALNLYATLVTPFVSGLPQAVSRLSAKHGRAALDRALKSIRLPLLMLTASVGLLSPLLAGVFLHDASAFALVLCLMPLLVTGALDAQCLAYLQAQGRAGRIALTEICEQLIRIGSLAGLVLFLKKGTVGDSLLPLLAMLCGQTFCFLRLRLACGKGEKGDFLKKEMTALALPPTASRFFSSLLHLATVTVLPLRLRSFGLSGDAAMAQYGILTGMAYPVLFLPLTVTSAYSSLFLPSVARSEHDKVQTKKKFFSAFFFSLAVCTLFALAVLLFAPYLAKAVLKQPLAGRYMVLLTPGIVLNGVNQMCSVFLAGLGKQKALFIVRLVEGTLGLLFTLILPALFGMEGFLLGNNLQDAITFCLLFVLCLRVLRATQKNTLIFRRKCGMISKREF